MYFCGLINIKRKKVYMRPDFSNIDFKKLPQNPTDFRQWEKDNNIIANWMTS